MYPDFNSRLFRSQPFENPPGIPLLFSTPFMYVQYTYILSSHNRERLNGRKVQQFIRQMLGQHYRKPGKLLPKQDHLHYIALLYLTSLFDDFMTCVNRGWQYNFIMYRMQAEIHMYPNMEVCEWIRTWSCSDLHNQNFTSATCLLI